jgi:peptidoglycan/LPS O-acetylase OafA/YrhL
MNRYRKEMAAALAAYCVVLVGSLWLLRAGGIASDALRTLVAIAPLVPALAVCWVIVRRVRRLDELQRRIELESLSIAFAGTALLTFGYGFLENAGYPRLSWVMVWPLMGALWLVSSMACSRRYR